MQSDELGTVALFGAAGAVGHALAPALKGRGIPCRAVGRNAAVLQSEFPEAQIAVADFLTGEGVRQAAQGASTIFYLAGAPYTEFFKHPAMVRNALEAAASAGVSRFIHIAPVYSYGYPKSRPVPESQPHDPQTQKGRFRLEQEQAVLDADRPGGMRTAIVHLPDFYGPNADLAYADAFLREVLSGKTASWLGSPSATREFVYVPDVADPLLRLTEHPEAFGRCWNLGGTAVEAQAFIRAAFAAAGRPPKYRAVPKILLQAMGLFNPLMREVAEMYYLFDSSFVLDDSQLRALIGEWPKTPLEQGLSNTVAWMRRT